MFVKFQLLAVTVFEIRHEISRICTRGAAPETPIAKKFHTPKVYLILPKCV